jgi:hypothetical protein
MDVESDINKNDDDTTIESNNEKKNAITNISENDKNDKNDKNERNDKYDKNVKKKYSGGIIVFDTSIQITLAPTPSLSSLPYSPLPSSVALMGVRR